MLERDENHHHKPQACIPLLLIEIRERFAHRARNLTSFGILDDVGNENATTTQLQTNDLCRAVLAKHGSDFDVPYCGEVIGALRTDT